VGEFYTPSAEGGLRYDDPRLRLKWPLEVSVISSKDQAFARCAKIEDEVKAQNVAGDGGGGDDLLRLERLDLAES